MAPRTRWRPTRPPGNVIKVQRTDENGATETTATAYIAETRRDGDRLHVRSEGPEGLLREIPLPFEPPGIAQSSDPEGFRHWWRQIHYAFVLPNPALVPPLPDPLPPAEEEIV